jgi:polysaccharide export outer membrane protein
MRFISLVAFCFTVAAFVASCHSVKPIQYVDGDVDVDTLPAEILYTEPVIQPGDMISVVVYSDNPVASSMYNQTSSGGSTPGLSGVTTQAAAPTGQSGYLVDSDGYIVMTGLGRMKVLGYTKTQLADSLVNYFQQNELLKNPAVDIRFLNFRVTLLGEVAKPGVYSVPTDKLSVLEALGLAGDLTIWAKKDKITVIREVGGKREFAKLDITQPDIFRSPYFYLKQNDIVMVGQNKRKVTASDQTTLRYIAVSTSVLSAIAILVNLFK